MKVIIIMTLRHLDSREIHWFATFSTIDMVDCSISYLPCRDMMIMIKYMSFVGTDAVWNANYRSSSSMSAWWIWNARDFHCKKWWAESNLCIHTSSDTRTWTSLSVLVKGALVPSFRSSDAIVVVRDKKVLFIATPSCNGFCPRFCRCSIMRGSTASLNTLRDEVMF